jgi:hypothetical protein
MPQFNLMFVRVDFFTGLFTPPSRRSSGPTSGIRAGYLVYASPREVQSPEEELASSIESPSLVLVINDTMLLMPLGQVN